MEANKRSEVLGEIEVSAQVLEVIAGIATSEVPGVHENFKSFSNDFLNYSPNREYRRGMNLTIEDGKFIVDAYVNIYYGVNVPEIAHKIQKNVRDQIYFMTEIEIEEVNVHIVKIIPEKMKLEDFLDEDGE